MARSTNARLPVALLRTQMAAEAVVLSESRRGPRVSLRGSLPYTPPGAGYGPGNSAGEDSLQLAARLPVYEGGALHGQIEADRQRLQAAQEGYRIDELDLDAEVRSRFSEVLRYLSEVTSLTQGLGRLGTYLIIVKARKASGRGTESDLLRTQVRIDEEQSHLDTARRGRDAANLELNDLLGRTLDQPVLLAALHEPRQLPDSTSADFKTLPDLISANAKEEAAHWQLDVARSSYRPHFSLFANTGLIDPGIGFPGPNPPLSQRVRDDFGVAVGVELSWDIWSFGAIHAQVQQAELASQQAAASAVVVRRKANLDYSRARLDLQYWFRELQTRNHQIPLARGAYVTAESLYRGGSSTAINVLDSFTALIGSEINRAEAIYQYRLSEARLLRWSGQ